jgi:hypothetical protein
MRQWFVDSRDRISGSTSDFQIQLREQLVSTKAMSFRIDDVRLPLVVPLIQQNYNDKLYFTLSATGTTVQSVTLTPGNWSGTDLASMIQTQLAASFAQATYGWVVTYNNHTAALSIQCNDTAFHVETDAELQTLKIATPSFASALFQNSYAYTTPSAGKTLLTWSYCSVQRFDMLYLCSTRLGDQDTFGPGGATDTLMCLVPNTDFASVLFQSMTADVWLNLPALTTNQIDFTLRDRFYNVVTGLPNISFVVTVRE